jgi:hypothetical protein
MVGPVKNDRAFFEAFLWPLPESFASAVAASRFELGDVLYRDARAYEAWSGEVPRGLRPIQVLDPPRSARGTPLEGDSDRRRANWSSEVRIALVDPVSGQLVERVLTQGKLLMALWRGDEAWLDAEREAPEFPKTARELHASLAGASAAWGKEVSRSQSGSGSLFVMVVDLASDASRAKAALVGDRLRASGEVVVTDRTPSDAGLNSAELYYPTLVLRGFVVPGRETDAVEAELRICLYRGGAAAPPTAQSDTKDAKEGESDETVTGDRFSIARHGLLTAF